MRQHLQHALFALAAIALTAAGAWHFREPLGRHLGRVIVEHASPTRWQGEVATMMSSGRLPAREPEPVGRQTVYRWVDADGVTHFDQHSGAGRTAVSVDPGRIQRLQDFTAAEQHQP